MLNGSTQVEVTDNKLSMPGGDVTVSAILKKYFNVTLTQVEGGTISASESKAVEGTAINLSYTAASDYSFDKWVITGTTVAIDGNSFLMPASDVNVTAVFKQRESGSGGDDDATDLSNGGTAVANCYIVAPSATEKKYKIPTSNSAGSVGAVTAAEVLWESFGTSTAPNVGDLVKEVSYANDYISFTTTGNAGNALIAAKNAEGVILWSWHIWITETPADQQYTETGYMMDRNLGATSAGPGKIGTVGLWYQWGRKDPFMAPQEVGSTIMAMSTISEWTSQTVQITIDESIKNPTLLIKNTEWVKDNTAERWKNGEKSLYDPCPAGYYIPEKTFFTSDIKNTSVTYDSSNVGISCTPITGGTTVWYPLAGYLMGNTDATHNYPGQRTGIWSSTSGTVLRAGNGYGLTTFKTLNNGGYANVRCKKQ